MQDECPKFKICTQVQYPFDTFCGEVWQIVVTLYIREGQGDIKIITKYLIFVCQSQKGNKTATMEI